MTLNVTLITLGDPETLTGGYLYHRRVAERAPKHSAHLDFESFPDIAFPLPPLSGLRVVKRVRASEVVVIDSIAATYLAPWAGRIEQPLVGMLHQPPGGIDHNRFRRAIQARLDRATYARCAALLAASEALAAELVTARLDESKIEVVAPGRDVGRVPPSPERLRGDPAVLCVGNWVARKGIVELLRAFVQTKRGILHLVGATDVEPRYSRRVTELLQKPELSKRVVVHGPQSSDRVAEMYAGADLFVLPSYREPYGTVLGEAIAAGLPVIGWRAGNLPHLATDGCEGILVEPGDVGALARAISTLSDDVARRKQMSDAARRRGEQFPTWDDTADQFFSALRRVAQTG